MGAGGGGSVGIANPFLLNILNLRSRTGALSAPQHPPVWGNFPPNLVVYSIRCLHNFPLIFRTNSLLIAESYIESHIEFIAMIMSFYLIKERYSDYRRGKKFRLAPPFPPGRDLRSSPQSWFAPLTHP